MDYDQLVERDLGKLGSAVADWKRMGGELQRLSGDCRDGLRAKADKAR